MPRKNIWLTPPAVEHLGLLTQKTGLTMSAVIQKALAEMVKKARL